jgi:2-phosphosulfolactate phosphatase
MVSLRHEGGKMNHTRLDTLLLPNDAPLEADICVVIDALRATSTLVTMFERGLAEAIVAPSLDEARAFARREPGLLLCGESGGLPPEDFDYGNSPRAFDAIELQGKRAVIATTNGTKALQAVQTAAEVLIAALLNAEAVARELAAGDVQRIVIVCAGEGGGTSVCIEDVFCAGAIVHRTLAMTSLDLDDGARIALRLYRSFDDSLEAFLAGEHGPALRDLGLAGDVAYCAQADVFSIVPRASRDADGVQRITVSGC